MRIAKATPFIAGLIFAFVLGWISGLPFTQGATPARGAAHSVTGAPLAVVQDTKDLPWVVYDGFDGPGKGKHIVLISGDEEYRSEEALPQLGKILAKNHGFKCTVLFAIDPKTGEINPMVNNNIPGLEQLKTADLMIIATRFRNLPEEQMQHIVDYLGTGKPIIGMRTATHAFLGMKGKFAKYNNGSGVKSFEGGFGRVFLGEQWINHYGKHGSQSTRGLLAKGVDKHPILKGIKDGDIWGPTDVYEVRLPMPAGCEPLVMGQVLVGMKSTDKPFEGKQKVGNRLVDPNDPMMPVAWTRKLKSGDRTTRVFTTTMGASEDLVADGTRRMLVNASYWCVGMEERIAAMSNVEIVGEYKASRFGNKGHKNGVRPSHLSLN